MTHALIIDENMIVSRAMKERLGSLGFDSFDRTWTETQAVAAATARQPDLVVIGDAIACGSPVAAAQHIAERFGVPILLVTAGKCEVRRELPRGAVLDGPFSLSDIGSAVAVACSPDGSAGPHGAEPLNLKVPCAAATRPWQHGAAVPASL